MIDYQEIARNRNEKNNFGNLIGVKITEMDHGTATTELEIKDNMLNPVGTIHGGVLFTLLDIACGASVASLELIPTTMSVDIHYLRPAFEGTKRLYGHGKVIKTGKRAIVVEGKITDDHDQVLAVALTTFASLPKSVIGT